MACSNTTRRWPNSVLGSVYRQLWGAFQTLLEQHLAQLPRSPFASPPRFTNAALHRYPPGPLGLSLHRDSARSINLVAIFVLRGCGRFIVCQDRTGRGAVDLPNAPGDLLLLRDPEITVEDIAHRLGVASSTLYRHLPKARSAAAQS